jgi:magnesium transporter
MNEKTGKPRITLIVYSREGFTSKKLSNLREALDFEDYDVVWVNIDGFSLADEVKEVFSVHERPMRPFSAPAPTPASSCFRSTSS